MSELVTTGRFYEHIVGDAGKYSAELKEKIEQLGDLCLSNLETENYSPIMMLGSIQSGKTRAFIGLLALCFDNCFDMAIILTKCSTALVTQTVKRMESEFDGLKSSNGTVGDIVAQDILDIDFSSAKNEQEKEKHVRDFLKRYPGKKRILVVKKQADNVDRINMLIRSMVAGGKYKRIIIVDDEADITSIGYEKDSIDEKLSLRRISGAINTARKQMNGDVNHVLLQVTATPYALYLQPETFSFGDIMPIKPQRTVVLPTGKGYIGAKYYFMDSMEEASPNYYKAQYLPVMTPQDEMDILNGTEKNKGKGKVLKDGRTFKKDNFLDKAGKKYPILSFRSWLFDCIVGAAIVQLNKEFNDCYLSAVMHLASEKSMHKLQVEILEAALSVTRSALEYDLHDPVVWDFAKVSYDNLVKSVAVYGVLRVPQFDEVMEYIAHRDEYNELDGLINMISIKQVNSDSDITTLLNGLTGELKLENYLTIFVGGQVIDRGITIPNLINFFYGRNPKSMQQDTVMQHCRMFGYRAPELLSVTRFYTTQRLFNNMQEIADRDIKLRERIEENGGGGIVYLESGKDVVSCSPDKIKASVIRSILPEKRYLPVGFNIKTASKSAKAAIDKILDVYKIGKQKDYNRKNGGEIDESYCNMVSVDDALEILRKSYEAIEPDGQQGKCNIIQEMENVFLFAVDPDNGDKTDNVALLVRRGRELSKFKTKNGAKVYQDAPDDGNNEGALAQSLRAKYPVLVLTEQTNEEWGKNPFWWPVFYTPSTMNVGIYSIAEAAENIYENIYSNSKTPMQIKDFIVRNNASLSDSQVEMINDIVNDIVSFHAKEFDYSDRLTKNKKRADVDCYICIDRGPSEKEEKRFERKLKQSTSKVKIIFESGSSGGISPSLQKDILAYFQLLDDGIFGEEADAVYEKVYDGLSKLTKKCVKAVYIRRYIKSLNEMIPQLYDTLGYLKLLGGTNFEIHLYYDYIAALAKNKEDIPALLAKVVSREMERAWHFVDVMTASGKWLYSRSSHLRQCWVQNTVAEYFSLQYCKQMEIVNKTAAINEFNKMDINKYPEDGGNSGALLLDGKQDVFDEVYLMSLTDLPDAYQRHLKQYAVK